MTAPHLTIRPLAADDVATAPAWLRERTILSDGWRDETTRTLIAVDDAGASIGAGIMWTSRVHPGRYSVDVAVAPEQRRRGIGSQLVAALAALQPEPHPFLWGADDADPGHAFVARFGARTIQQAPLDPVPTAHAARLRPDDRVAPAATASPTALEDAWADTYEWTHADWHPMGSDARGPLTEKLWDEIDPELSSITVAAGGEITAVLLVFGDGDVPIIAGETVTRDTSDGARLLEGCMRRCLDGLARRGVAESMIDGHVSDPHLAPLFDKLGPITRWHRVVEFRP